ncbi:PQQ-binding-like beta-propeller repeat protein [Luteolibacter pohnpeiensis]|uniref:PQQ-binding-like beta-propeller repeat protein n=1 Tax=Luteolibacter pohnpeiensis TaxID=454153 RepID=A0A934SFM0_9BACT|nr:PQQ-binding-like beta-propeller repeat protein [Luteolibacter pohnpeiensis]MBK1884298.1 PQQ-binding-like beta-propeller repeat protein [Luteolibacter pohnpeiensis]
MNNKRPLIRRFILLWAMVLTCWFIPKTAQAQQGSFPYQVQTKDLIGIGLIHQAVKIGSLQIDGGNSEPWTISSNQDWLHIDITSGSGPAEVPIYADYRGFTTTGESPQSTSGTLTIQADGKTQTFPISATGIIPQIQTLAAQPKSRYLFGSSRNPYASGSLLFRIDTVTGEIDENLKLTDILISRMAFDLDRNELFLTENSADQVLVFQLDTLEAKRSISLDHIESVNRFFMGDDGNLWATNSTNKSFLIYDSNSGDYLYSYDIGSSNFVATRNPISGKFVKGETSNFSNGTATTKLFECSLTNGEVTIDRTIDFGTVLPISGNTSCFFSADGSRLFWGNYIFDENYQIIKPLDKAPTQTMLGGRFMVDDDQIINIDTGAVVMELPQPEQSYYSSFQGLSSDEQRIVMILSGVPTVIDLAEMVSNSSPIEPGIADGAVVSGLEQTLSWESDPLASSYRIYFGKDRQEVESATPESASYLGQTTETTWTESLPELEPSAVYYWRVERAYGDQSDAGETWEFQIWLMSVAPAPLVLDYPKSAPIPDQEVTVSAYPGTTGGSWNILSHPDWLDVSKTSGIAGESFSIHIDNSLTQDALIEGTIVIETGGAELPLPIQIQRYDLQLQKLIADQSFPFVYGLTKNPDDDGEELIVKIDAASATIVDSLVIPATTDNLLLDVSQNRLGFSSQTSNEIGWVDLESWTIGVATPVAAGVKLASAFGDGRLIVYYIQGGPGIEIFSPSGTSLLQTQNPDSSATILTASPNSSDFWVYGPNTAKQYSISGDGLGIDLKHTINNLTITAIQYSNSGERLALGQYVIATDGLQNISAFSEGMTAFSQTGQIASGRGSIYIIDSGETLVSPPYYSSGLDCWSAYDLYLIRFNAADGTLHSLATNDINPYFGTNPVPDAVLSESPDNLTWEQVEGAEEYRLYLIAGSESPGTEDMVYQGSANTYILESALAPGYQYTWRVDAVVNGVVVEGETKKFSIQYEIADPESIGTSDPGTGKLVLTDDSLFSGYLRSLQIQPFEGSDASVAASIWQYTSSDAQVSAVAAKGPVMVGAYSQRLYDGKLGAGEAVITTRMTSGSWTPANIVHAEIPQEYGNFGNSLATDGDLVAIGMTPSISSNDLQPRAGSVQVYLTNPEVELLQTIHPPNSANDGAFGSALAISGNDLIVSAPGNGTGGDSFLFVYRRSSATGLFEYLQSIPMSSEGTPYPVTALDMNEDVLVAGVSSLKIVQIFTKNSEGLWTATQQFRGSFTGFGSKVDLEGTHLFVSSGLKNGSSGLYTYHFDSGSWIAGTVITSPYIYYYADGFAGSYTAHGAWLVIGRGSNEPKILRYRIEDEEFASPYFTSNLPGQVPPSQWTTTLSATDPDSTDLQIQLLTAPTGATLDKNAEGTFSLTIPAVGSNVESYLIRLRVTDPEGNFQDQTTRVQVDPNQQVTEITASPIGGDFREGDDAYLFVKASGGSDLQYQWYFNGEPIPGATSSFLPLPNIGDAQAGSYYVEVSSVTSTATSEPVDVGVTPPDLSTDDWTTTAVNPRRTNAVPALLGDLRFRQIWSQSGSNAPTHNPIIVEGKAYVAMDGSGATKITKLDLQTGEIEWQSESLGSSAIVALSYFDGSIYVSSDTWMSDYRIFALDSETGETRWNRVLNTEEFSSVTSPQTNIASDEGMFIVRDTGHVFGLTTDGDPIAAPDDTDPIYWKPTLFNGKLYGAYRKDVQSVDPETGEILWTLQVPEISVISGFRNQLAIYGDRALVHSLSRLVCIDLNQQSVVWSVSGYFINEIAVSKGIAYVMNGDGVAAYSVEDGSLIRVYATGLAGDASPVVFLDYLLVPGQNVLNLVNLESGEIEQTLPISGGFAFADGILVAQSSTNGISAWIANDEPLVSDDFPSEIAANNSASTVSLDLNTYVTFASGGGNPTWNVVSNSNAALFDSLTVDANGILTADFDALNWGQASVTIAFSDPLGNEVQRTIEFSVPEPAAPAIRSISPATLNRVTGLYEQTITLSNSAQRAIAGFTLNISGLREDVTLYNGSETVDGGGSVEYQVTIPIRTSVTIVIEYYSELRGELEDPQITASVISSQEITQQTVSGDDTNTFAVSRILPLEDKSVLIEFPSEPDASYRIQYSNDAVTWKISPPSITAGGTKVQWIDRGPPWTDAAPSTQSQRFYRIERLDP